MRGKNMAYELDERETIITTDDNSNNWNVYTRQRKIINKLKKLGYEAFNEEVDDGRVIACEFNLNIGKITFRKAIANERTYTDEQRAEMVARLQKREN